MFPKCGVSRGNGVGFTFRNRSRGVAYNCPIKRYVDLVYQSSNNHLSCSLEIRGLRGFDRLSRRESCVLLLEHTWTVLMECDIPGIVNS